MISYHITHIPGPSLCQTRGGCLRGHRRLRSLRAGRHLCPGRRTVERSPCWTWCLVPVSALHWSYPLVLLPKVSHMSGVIRVSSDTLKKHQWKKRPVLGIPSTPSSHLKSSKVDLCPCQVDFSSHLQKWTLYGGNDHPKTLPLSPNDVA